MMRTLRNLGVSLLLCLALTAQGQQLTEEQAAQVIARVGDEEITAGQFARDLQFRLSQIKSATGKEPKPDLRMRRALMTELIELRILSIAARNAGATIDDAKLEAQFEERKKIFDSDDAYKSYLNALMLTEKELKERMRSRMRVSAFVDEKTGVLAATENEISERYALLKSQGKMTRTANTRDISVILIRAKGGTDESWRGAEERAKAAKARILAGEDFAAVAKEVSDDPNTAPNGGLLSEMRLGSFYPELEESMDGLAIGEISEPIRSVMGWYVLSVLEKNEPGIVPLEKVTDRLERQIIEEKKRAAVKEIVADAQRLIPVQMMELNLEDAAAEPEAQ